MSIHWTLTDARDFSIHAERWDALNTRAGGLPFHDSRFLIPLLQVFGSGDEKLAVARRGGSDVCAAIVTKTGTGQWSSFQPSQLPLGALLIAAGEDIRTLGASLVSALPGCCIALGLTEIDPLHVPRPSDDATFETLDYIATAWVDVSGSFDDYWAQRGKNLRQNMKKQRNKLAAENIDSSLELLRAPEAVAGAIAEFGALESAGWKAGMGTAVSRDNDQGRFYTQMLESFCAADRGAIYRYRFGDKTVAMDLCIETDGLIVILKTTYDSSNSNLSPAFLMREEQFRQMFEQARICRIEFYGKVMEWHTRWTENARMLYHANLYRWSVIPRVKHLRSKLRTRQAIAEAEHAPT